MWYKPWGFFGFYWSSRCCWMFYVFWRWQETRGGSRATATSKMERFVIIVNGCSSSIHQLYRWWRFKILFRCCCTWPIPWERVKKLECLGHMQKRLGARLRKLKTTNKSALSDGKPIGGKIEWQIEWLISSKIFGIAIRQSKANVFYKLKKAIGAVLFHCSEVSNLDTRRQMCSCSSESWCKFQADRIITLVYAKTEQDCKVLSGMLLNRFLLI